MTATRPPAPTVAPTLSDRAEYLALRGMVAALGAVPWGPATRAGSALAALGYRPFGIRRRVVERQIAAAFPGLGDGEVRKVARLAFEHLGRVTVEAALMSRLGAEDVLALVERQEGWELVERALARGRGLIVVSGHLGNWELAGAYLAARGASTDVVARRMGNRLFDAYLSRTRSRLGMNVVHDRDAVRRVPRALRANHVVAFLVDQSARTLASSHVPFFGRPAKTPRGPAVFALRSDAPLIYGALVRQPGGRYLAHLEEIGVERTGELERDVDRVVGRYTAALERWVRRYPEQYFWHHRRWKRQPPDTPVEFRNPA